MLDYALPEHRWAMIAVLATVLVEGAYVPQLLRLLRLKDATSIALIFPGLSVTGRLIAIAYMAHKGESIFAYGIFFGVLLRATFFTQCGYYKYRQWRLRRFTEQMVQI